MQDNTEYEGGYYLITCSRECSLTGKTILYNTVHFGNIDNLIFQSMTRKEPFVVTFFKEIDRQEYHNIVKLYVEKNKES